MLPTKKNVARSFAFLLLGFGSWLGCKTTEVASIAKITGGSADNKSFPATVALVGLNGKNDLIGFCTGTFIRDDLVITRRECHRRQFVANRGRGYGKIFDCNGLRCAHHDSALTKECVLAAIVYED